MATDAFTQLSNQYYGCDNGPCDELNRLTSTPQQYSAFTQEYLDCLPDPTPFPCSAITHCISGSTNSKTPILIVSNSMYVEKPKELTDYIGNENSGFNSGSGNGAWDWDKASFTIAHINCGVPFPNDVGGPVPGAINVCGNVYISGHLATVNVTIVIYSFECDEEETPTLTQLGSITKAFPTAEEPAPGVNRCWSLDINTEDPLSECSSYFLISFRIGEGETAKILKSSYKATIEKIS